ncbi:DUF2141 domain-containing protein [Flavisolibacter nicotianae]|uniref:DUF2141 domain-containing protein n=1 Tax=Flavisolibacter nicotianae TaxID=2364882 RepID=UPI000EAE4FC1|nr:DUF2141 domain-containing protein [Flavisolibacter nicotianae]
MKSLFILLLLAVPLASFSQAKITVQVTDFNNNNGLCLVCLFDNAKGFAGKGTPLRILRTTISNKTATAVFDNIPAGVYAISVIHDANSNNRFDTNFMGIPTEGYGASKNKLPFAAAPRFDENKFAVGTATDTSLVIRLRYLL